MEKTEKSVKSTPNGTALFSTVNKTSSEEFLVYTDGEGRQCRIAGYFFPHGFHHSSHQLSMVSILTAAVPGVLLSSHLPLLNMCVLDWRMRFS